MAVKVHIEAEVEARLVELLAGDRRFELVDDLRAARILVTRTTNRVTRELIAGAPELVMIAQATSGIDNIDVAAAEERGIRIIHLPGVNANAVAELVIGHIIALTRTVNVYSREVISGVWNRRDCATRHELRHYALGIVGLGNVGSRVARIAHALGMRVLAYDPYITEFGPAVRVTDLDDLLRGSDIVTLHVPLNAETRRMVGVRELSLMQRGSFLVNAARGEVLDVRAALGALESDALGGLALDVFDPEPPSVAWPDDARLIVTPHIAGCTHEAKSAAAEMLYQRLAEWAAERG